MIDPRRLVGLHAYPMPGKDHPVSASDVKAGRLTLKCPRCQKTKSIDATSRGVARVSRR